MFIKFKNYFTKEKVSQNELNIFNELKKKITQLIFLEILNIHTASIIKECSKYMCAIFKSDEKLKEEILELNKDKIKQLLNKIDINEIKNSNCALNEETIKCIQKEDINALLIICKSIGLNDLIKKEDLIQKIKPFDNIDDEKYENSQLILFYGFISVFLYVDISENKVIINDLFNLILTKVRLILKYPSKKLINFTQTRYGGKVIKLIIKYRKEFSRYIVMNSEDEIKNKFVIEFIKIILSHEKNILICESLFKEIAGEFKDEIINMTDKNNYSKENLVKVAQLLKICRKISENYRIYLKSTSLLEITSEYIKNLIFYYNQNIEKKKLESIIHYKKIIKYWIKLNTYYIDTFNNKKLGLNNLFFCESLPNISKIEKNKIDFTFIYQLNLIQNEKDYEKKI